MAKKQNRELNCSWNFPDLPENGSLVGPNEPMTENFKKTPYASIVREAIQNSLDERYDKSKPLEMSFKVKTMPFDNYPNFLDIKNHIKGCLEFYPSHGDIYNPMLKFMSKVERTEKLPYIQISDYNANGMRFNQENPNDPESPFVAFVRAAGLSTKTSNNAGGSFGFGKAAYFYLSPIRTILVSTFTKDGNCYFEGVSSLCTHKYNGVNKMAIGYYDSKNGLPITDNECIPNRFKRIKEDADLDRPGTDIYIMGIRELCDNIPFENSIDYIYDEMTFAVLRNFWMAIYDNMLNVTIGDRVINKENLLETMETFFAEEDDSSRRYIDYNPLPYLRMVINAHNNERNHHIFTFSSVNDKNSKIILYLHKKKTANDRVLFMRSPRMLVKQDKKRNKRGYYGTLICTGGEWDTWLRYSENPAHNEWDKDNYDKDWRIKNQIGELLDDIFKFVRDKIDELFASNSSSDDTIKDLEQYLYIPTEADDDDDFMQESIMSNPTGEFKEEGSSITSDSDITPEPKSSENNEYRGVVLQPKPTTSSADPTGDRVGGHGGSNGGKGGRKGGTRYITEVRSGDEDAEDKTTNLHFVPVRYRSFAQIENDEIFHYIVIHTDYDIPNGRIDLKVGTEGEDELINIISSDKGQARDNTIINLSLVQGSNKIKIRFADNMKHSVKLDTYEIK